MDDRANDIGARPSAAERPQESGGASLWRGGRMSRQRKTAAVLRLLRGEDLETISRQLGVTAATLTGWHDAFLAAGEAALTTRAATGEELESDRLKTRLCVRTFATIEELRQALLAFRETYNTTWLIERHGFLTPAQFRQKQLQSAAIAA